MYTSKASWVHAHTHPTAGMEVTAHAECTPLAQSVSCKTGKHVCWRSVSCATVLFFPLWLSPMPSHPRSQSAQAFKRILQGCRGEVYEQGTIRAETCNASQCYVRRRLTSGNQVQQGAKGWQMHMWCETPICCVWHGPKQ